jgi:hypothetical protein
MHGNMVYRVLFVPWESKDTRLQNKSTPVATFGQKVGEVAGEEYSDKDRKWITAKDGSGKRKTFNDALAQGDHDIVVGAFP